MKKRTERPQLVISALYKLTSTPPQRPSEREIDAMRIYIQHLEREIANVFDLDTLIETLHWARDAMDEDR